MEDISVTIRGFSDGSLDREINESKEKMRELAAETEAVNQRIGYKETSGGSGGGNIPPTMNMGDPGVFQCPPGMTYDPVMKMCVPDNYNSGADNLRGFNQSDLQGQLGSIAADDSLTKTEKQQAIRQRGEDSLRGRIDEISSEYDTAYRKTLDEYNKMEGFARKGEM